MSVDNAWWVALAAAHTADLAAQNRHYRDAPMDGSAAMSHETGLTSPTCPAKRLSPTSDTTARNEQTKPAGGHTKGEA